MKLPLCEVLLEKFYLNFELLEKNCMKKALLDFNVTCFSTSRRVGNIPSMIKPNLRVQDVEDLVFKLTGIQVQSVKQLDSYDDQNFLLETKSHERLVLKISNSEDTDFPDLLEETNRLLLHCHDQGIKVPKPRVIHEDKTVTRVFIKDTPGVKFALRIMDFLPGKTLLEVLPLTSKLLFDCGLSLAKLTKVMSSFKSPVLELRQTIWSLMSLDSILEILPSVDDQDNRDLVLQVIQTVNQEVLSKSSSLPSQLIHSDFNEANILVEEEQVCGIIDFDVHFALRVFDIANLILYMILVCKDQDMNEVGRDILSGYSTLITLTDLEKSCLVYSMCGRLIQSLVLGAHALKKQPDNQEYLSRTAINGWQVLRLLLKNRSSLESTWFS